MSMIRILECALTIATFLLLVGCGDGDSTPFPSSNPGGSTGGATITVTSNGVSPQNVTVARGAQVTFVNNDTRPHDIRSDPHSSHSECPEINQVGTIQPGNNRQTGNLTIARTCEFHDDADPSSRSFQGTIRVQ
jgi:plastocyanin